jgi:hypothetical protein
LAAPGSKRSFTTSPGGREDLSPGDLIAGPGGVLYGVTSQGASTGCYVYVGCGAAFSLTPPATPGGPWTLNVIYTVEGSFYSGGATSLTMGANGVLYGTTAAGVYPCYQNECGTVYSLTPPTAPGDAWTQAVLHSFTGWPADGNNPNASLALGPNGQIYGTTYLGASQPCGQEHAGCGTVFELTPPASPGGAWTETVLHHFTGGSDGGEPFMTPVIAKDGALYGATGGYGNWGYGTVFIMRHP